MKKTFALFIVIVMAASFITGCQPQPDPQANAAAPPRAAKQKKLNEGFTNPT